MLIYFYVAYNDKLSCRAEANGAGLLTVETSLDSKRLFADNSSAMLDRRRIQNIADPSNKAPCCESSFFRRLGPFPVGSRLRHITNGIDPWPNASFSSAHVLQSFQRARKTFRGGVAGSPHLVFQEPAFFHSSFIANGTSASSLSIEADNLRSVYR